MISPRIVFSLALAAMAPCVASAAATAAGEAALVRAFECKGLADNLVDALEARGIPFDGASFKPVELSTPLIVFGFRVTQVQAFVGGEENRFTSYFPVPASAVAAKLGPAKGRNSGASYVKRTPKGSLLLADEHSGSRLVCSVVIDNQD